jgi:hypothetical protein
MEVIFDRPPLETYRAWRLAGDARDATKKRFPLGPQNSRGELWHNKAGDAYRHFYWSFAMTRSMGKEAAKAYADSHEIDDGQPANEGEMDLNNNRLGRAMAVDPRFKGLSPTEAAEKALSSGWLHGLKQ